jgi:hypothetical protein
MHLQHCPPRTILLCYSVPPVDCTSERRFLPVGIQSKQEARRQARRCLSVSRHCATSGVRVDAQLDIREFATLRASCASCAPSILFIHSFSSQDLDISSLLSVTTGIDVLTTKAKERLYPLVGRG